MTRRRHRIDDDGRLLPLKLVYRTDSRAGKALLTLKDLGVVGCDDQYVFEPDRQLDAFAIYPRGTRVEDLPNEIVDFFGFLSRRTLIARMLDGHVAQACSG